MTKKHEELVEEIARNYIQGKHKHWEWACRDARSIITLFLSAFHDGRLDEESGVIYRNTFRGYQEINALFLASERGDARLPGSFHIDPPLKRDELGRGEEIEVIVLRPLTGTGKEGENGNTNKSPTY